MCKKSEVRGSAPLRVVLGLTVLLAGGSRVVGAAAVVASQSHSLVLSADGGVCSVGQNDQGQLGDATAVDRSVRVAASMVAGSVSVAAGYRHGLAVKGDGTVWSWGYNAEGELGDNSSIEKPTPNPVPGLSGFKAVAAGQYHSLALKNDGTVWAWGYNGDGQLGDGTSTERLTPVQVINVSGIQAIAAGRVSSYAIASDGTVLAWGNNGAGQLGDGTFQSRPNAMAVQNLSGVARIASGASHVLALKTSGEVWGWGYNGDGELGDGSTVTRPSVVRATNLTGMVAIAGGDRHSLAVDSNGSVWAWGLNNSGQLGNGTTVSQSVPVQLSTFSGAALIAAGTASSFALKTDGSFYTWGDNTYGQLGTGTTMGAQQPVAALACVADPVAPGPPRSSLTYRLAADQNSSVAIAKTNTGLAWGQNQAGQLGDGTTVSRTSATAVVGLAGAVDVALGYSHGLAAKTDGTVSSWGANANGQLGDGTTISRTTPIIIPNFGSAIAVAAGQYHSLALKNDGTVWAWGYNGDGQLGDGSTVQRAVPVRVINLTGAVAIAAGRISSYALKNDGTVWAWGNNGSGQLGDSTYTSNTAAVQVASLKNVVAIAAGIQHALALKNDGTVWAWGYNGQGELGDGSSSNRPNVVRASGLTQVVALGGGQLHSLAVKRDGTVWAWGSNDSGQLGDGSSNNSPVPVQVPGLSSALAVAAGTSHSLALLRDGSIWAWGSNSTGQFGTPTPAASTVPVGGPGGFPFGPIYSLTLSTTGGGASGINSNPGSSDGNYVVGTQVCVSPATAVGSVFTRWTGASLNASSCLTVSADAYLIANFTPTEPLRFVPVTPCRVSDTRDPAGPFGAPVLAAASTRDFVVPQSACGIPATAQAYSLNFTVVPTKQLTYLSAWPSGTAQPDVSILNSFDGRVKANAAIVPAGANGAISVYASDETQAIIDINGYFVPASSGANSLSFYPVTPCRLVDTRENAGPLGAPSLPAGTTRTFPLQTGTCGLSGNAMSYSLNITVVPTQPLSYLTVWPAGQAQPLVSTLNANTGAVTANAAIVPAGTAGDISVYTTGSTDLIIDVNGYFAAPDPNAGLSFYKVPPCRIVDTRNPAGAAPISGTNTFNAAASSCYTPAGAQSLVLNATVVPPAPLAYLTLWPAGQTQPVVSTLNAFDATVSSNLALVPDTAGAVSAFAASATQLILDISGYFAKP